MLACKDQTPACKPLLLAHKHKVLARKGQRLAHRPKCLSAVILLLHYRRKVEVGYGSTRVASTIKGKYADKASVGKDIGREKKE